MDIQILKAENIGNIVREARKLQGLTQTDVAAISGTNRTFISDLEGGKPTCQLGKVLAVCSALGIALHGVTKWKTRP